MRKRLLGAALAGVLISPHVSHAQSKIALSAGLANHRGEHTDASGDYRGQGLGFAGELDRPLSATTTLNFAVTTSQESFSGEFDDSGGHSSLTVGGRWWSQSGVFFGPHVGVYLAVLEAGSNAATDDAIGVGLGYGLTLGWESDGGLFVMGQYDVVPGLSLTDVDDTIDVEVDLSGFQLRIGKRFTLK